MKFSIAATLIVVSSVMSLLVLSVPVSAADVQFQIFLDRDSIYLGESAQLSIHFEGSTKILAMDVSDLEGFQSRYLGPSTRMSIVNGKMSSSVTHIYSLVPVKTGKFTIGPLSFEHDGDRYTSNKVAIEVLDSAARAGEHSQQKKTHEIQLEDRIFLEMDISKSRLYLNEIAQLHVKLYVNSMSVRDVQYPQYNHEGFSVEDFGKPREYQVNRAGTRYSVLDFQTEIFATKTGEFKLGPASLKANIVTRSNRQIPRSSFNDFFRDGFFGGYESTPIEIASDALTIEALSLPEENRPEDFKGAIGNFQLDVSVSPDKVKAGDPVTLYMIVSGTGNFNAVHSPVIKNKEGFKMYDPQIKLEPNRKVFEQVLIPTDDNIEKLPDILFSYFDTVKGQYKTIVKSNVMLKVSGADKEEITILDPSSIAERPLKKEVLGRDIIYIKESPGDIVIRDQYLYNNPVFLALQLLPLIIFIAGVNFHKKRERLSSDKGYARRLAAPRKAKKGIRQAEEYAQKNMALDFHDAVFRTLRDYLGNRFHVPSGGITAEALDTFLAGKGIDKHILDRLKNIFNECDMVRYAPSGINETKMHNTLREMKEIIDYLERHKDEEVRGKR